MPFFHHAPIRAALPVRTGFLLFSQCPSRAVQRSFHASRPLRDDDGGSDKNHYETLNVHPEASQADIKKSFYTLSKTHHPDHNPSDPHAPKRFMRISEAYTVLSHSDRRARYDRDVMRLRTHSTHHAHRHSGSYSSTGPAGGRPASGLSRRRGTFTGPPPSFFRSGGWGAHGAKRRAAHEDSTGTAGMGRGGGMGPGQDPTHSAEGAAPHFDHEGHERMHRRYEGRRAKRAEEGGPVVDTGSFGRFVVVTVSLVFAFGVPWWLATRGDGRGRKKKDAG